MKPLYPLFFVLSLIPGLIAAQESDDLETMKRSEGEVNLGWDRFLRLDATTLIADHSARVGEVDGTSFTIGHQEKFALFYYAPRDEWRNRLLFKQRFSRDPTLAVFTKTTDQLDYQSLYLRQFSKPNWLGLFARFSLMTSVLPSYSYQTAASDFLIRNQDGTTNTRTSDQLRLTDPFKPLRLGQSLGFFARPLKDRAATLELFAGFGFEETFAKGQRIVEDDPNTAEIEVSELRNVYEGGPDLAASLFGNLYAEVLHYRVDFDLLLPVIDNQTAADDRSPLELTSYHLQSSVLIRPLTWMTIDYGLALLKEPQIIDKIQLSHVLSIDLGHTLFGAKNEATEF